jgi:hypothetical protein
MAATNFLKAAISVLTVVVSPAAAFVSPIAREVARLESCHHAFVDPSERNAYEASSHFNDNSKSISHRRSFLHDFSAMVAVGSSMAVLSLPGVARAEAETLERGGVKLTPFNSLSFNYRGTLFCVHFYVLAFSLQYTSNMIINYHHEFRRFKSYHRHSRRTIHIIFRLHIQVELRSSYICTISSPQWRCGVCYL